MSIFGAIRENDPSTFERILKDLKETKRISKSEDKLTPLALAASKGRQEMVLQLLASGEVEDINGQVDLATTPLYLALKNGHFFIARILFLISNISLERLQQKALEEEKGLTGYRLASHQQFRERLNDFKVSTDHLKGVLLWAVVHKQKGFYLLLKHIALTKFQELSIDIKGFDKLEKRLNPSETQLAKKKAKKKIRKKIKSGNKPPKNALPKEDAVISENTNPGQPLLAESKRSHQNYSLEVKVDALDPYQKIVKLFTEKNYLVFWRYWTKLSQEDQQKIYVKIRVNQNYALHFLLDCNKGFVPTPNLPFNVVTSILKVKEKLEAKEKPENKATIICNLQTHAQLTSVSRHYRDICQTLTLDESANEIRKEGKLIRAAIDAVERETKQPYFTNKCKILLPLFLISIGNIAIWSRYIKLIDDDVTVIANDFLKTPIPGITPNTTCSKQDSWNGDKLDGRLTECDAFDDYPPPPLPPIASFCIDLGIKYLTTCAPKYNYVFRLMPAVLYATFYLFYGVVTSTVVGNPNCARPYRKTPEKFEELTSELQEILKEIDPDIGVIEGGCLSRFFCQPKQKTAPEILTMLSTELQTVLKKAETYSCTEVKKEDEPVAEHRQRCTIL